MEDMAEHQIISWRRGTANPPGNTGWPFSWRRRLWTMWGEQPTRRYLHEVAFTDVEV